MHFVLQPTFSFFLMILFHGPRDMFFGITKTWISGMTASCFVRLGLLKFSITTICLVTPQATFGEEDSLHSDTKGVFPGRPGAGGGGGQRGEVTWVPYHGGTLETLGHSSQVSLSRGKGVWVHSLTCRSLV